jgi:hypothetical protein
LVGRGFYYAQLGGVATLIAAGAANAQVSEGVATLAMLNVLNGMIKGLRQPLSTLRVVLQQMKRHA